MLKYFEPKKFERWRGKSVYEFLGVKFFKRYLLLTDLAIFRLRGRKQMEVGQGVLKGELQRIEWETKRNEAIHLLFMLLIGFILVLSFPKLSIEQFLGIFAINLYANIYPIFVQRYNRFRIIRLLREKDI